MFYFVLAIVIAIVVFIVKNIVIVHQAEAFILEQLGAYKDTWHTGLHLKVPFIQRVAKKVSLKEQVLDYPPQPVITKDNVTMQIDTVVYFVIKDPKLFTYGVENPMAAMETLTATTLRNIIGELELDETLTSRDKINSRMSLELDEATDPWGIRVNRVELKNIMPPKDIQEAMEKQMRAEREKRESILRAEGEKQSSILQAEGEKESAILRAEAQKITMLKEAEAHADSIRLHKQAEAEGIVKVQGAEAHSIKLLKEAGLSADDIVKIKGFEALKVAADGRSTKIIIPADVQNLAGTASALVESVKQ